MILYTLPFATDVLEADTIEKLKEVVEEMPECERCGEPAHQDRGDYGNYCSSQCAFRD
jgi:hypothetical protein